MKLGLSLLEAGLSLERASGALARATGASTTNAGDQALVRLPARSAGMGGGPADSCPWVVVGPEYLVPLIHRTVETIKVDARRKPDSLPPRLKIPGSSKLLWLETDIAEWLQSCRMAKQADAPAAEPKTPVRTSIFRGRK